MIKFLRATADFLQNIKCDLHFKWNAILDNLKTECQCERSIK